MKKRTEENMRKCRELRARIADGILKVAEFFGHTPNYVGANVFDAYTCSCGWKGKGFWDDNTQAYDEWLKHALYIIGEADWPPAPPGRF